MSPQSKTKYKSEYYKKNREKIRAQRAAYYASNPEMREKALANARAWYAANRDRRNLIRRRWELKQYGLTLEAYEEMYRIQEGRCLICNTFACTLAVDHRHADNVVRGLLCGPCNRSLGLFKDSPVLLRKAATYLERVGPA